MDLMKVAKPEEAAMLELRLPGGEKIMQDAAAGDAPRPVTLEVWGFDSPTAQAIRDAQQNKYASRRVREPTTAESAREENIAYLAGVTRTWDGVVVNGEAWPCDDEHKTRFFREFPMFREQVERFHADRANFLKASPQS